MHVRTACFDGASFEPIQKSGNFGRLKLTRFSWNPPVPLLHPKTLLQESYIKETVFLRSLPIEYAHQDDIWQSVTPNMHVARWSTKKTLIFSHKETYILTKRDLYSHKKRPTVDSARWHTTQRATQHAHRKHCAVAMILRQRQWVISHIWMSHVSRMNESCLT